MESRVGVKLDKKVGQVLNKAGICFIFAIYTLNRVFRYRGLGRYEDAIRSYEEAIKIKPDYVDAWNNKGNALGSM